MEQTTAAFEPSVFLYIAVFVIFFLACYIFKWLNLPWHDDFGGRWDCDEEEYKHYYFWLGHPHVERYKQFFTPLLAVIYIAVVLYFINDINELYQDFILWCEAFGNNHAPATSSVITGKWDLFKLWIAQHSGGKPAVRYLKLALCNFAIVVVYAVLKYLLLLLFKNSAVLNNEFCYACYDLFYDYDEENGKWYLREKHVQMREMYRVLYFLVSIGLSYIFILAIKYRGSEYFENQISPAFALLLFGDLFFFFDGVTRGEWIALKGGEPSSYRIFNYSLMLKQLKGLFGERLAHSELRDNSAVVGSDKSLLLKQLKESKDHDENLVGEYFSVYARQGGNIDVDYIKSTVSMLKGNSMLFQTPFFKDLCPYAFFPMNRELLLRRKVLVILGRNGIEESIAEWITEGLAKVNHTPTLWKVAVMGRKGEFADDADIRIVPMSELYNVNLINKNKEFLDKVSFILFIEPSKTLTTCQLGLKIFAETFKNKKHVYCICDRNCDGLVDSLSHILATNLVTVAATSVPNSICSNMSWKVDGKPLHHKLYSGLARYLGFGTELGTLAVKDGVSKVSWYSAENFPVTDMHWIAGQYNETLCKFMDIPVDQNAMDKHLKFEPNYWSAEVERNVCLVAEDEFNNMFEVRRQFATRALEQNFINVLSPNYMLRDYMAENPNIFYKDSKAIPSIVADEAITERNLLFCTLMWMHYAERDEAEIEYHFNYAGIQFTKGQIKEKLKELIEKYLPGQIENAEEDIFETSTKTVFDEYNNVTQKCYCRLRQGTKLDKALVELRNAYYLPEDDSSGNYLGAKLFGHIYQSFLPGQFITLSGKYYEVMSVTTEHGVIMRRASDHIKDRRYYRQLRNYKLTNWDPDDDALHIGRKQRTFDDILLEYGTATVEVTTDGYLELANYNDLQKAVRVALEQKVKKRKYVCKNVLRIAFKDASKEVLLTIALLFNELFRTAYPDAAGYITALSGYSKDSALEEGMLYNFDSGEVDDDYIYIIEDSQLDIGLLVSFERNLHRFLAIICDYLMWHRSLLSIPKRYRAVIAARYSIPSDDRILPKKCWDWLREYFAKKKIALTAAKVAEAEQENAETQKQDEAQSSEPETANVTQETVAQDTEENSASAETENTETDDKEENSVETEAAAEETERVSENMASKIDSAESVSSEQIIAEDAGQKADAHEDAAKEAAEIKTEAEKITQDNEQAAKESEEKTADETAAVDAEQPAEAVHEEDKTEAIVEFTDESDVCITPYGECYHDCNCQTVRDSDLTHLTVAEAREKGYVACKLCIKISKEQRQKLIDRMYELLGSDGLDLSEAEQLAAMRNASGNEKLENCDELAVEDIEWIIRQAEIALKKYMDTYYLLYGKTGRHDLNDDIHTCETVQYLSHRRFDRNSLRQARVESDLAYEYAPIAEGEKRYVCDFCGKELTGVEFERMSDGRIRCNLCAESGVTKVEDIEQLFMSVLRTMETLFNISLRTKIKVEFTDTAEIIKWHNSKYVPTPKGYDDIPVAIKPERDCSVILLQHGLPRLSAIAWLAYALTLVWEHTYWDKKLTRKQYGFFAQREVYHGLAVWTMVQYLIFVRQHKFAERLLEKYSFENGIYGRGLCRYMNEYPFADEQEKFVVTPFKANPVK